MSIVVQIHQDRNGCVLVETDPKYDLLGRFMELHFGVSNNSCPEMLEVVQKIRLHRSCSFIILGCSIAVTITESGATFRSLQGTGRTCEISLNDFVDVLQRW